MDMQKALEYQQLERLATDIDKGFRRLFATLSDTYLHNRTSKKCSPPGSIGCREQNNA